MPHQGLSHHEKLTWTHPKHGKHKYKGSYHWARHERVFELYCKEKKHRVTFESFQAARDLGWLGK
jgi:hypothetical protein